MSNYARWEEQTVGITTLLLDPLNPRIPDLGHEPSQREIASELVHHEGVYDLARDIAAQGFFPTEILVCIVENEQLTVVEGNRRLAALKLLLSPDLASQEFVNRFRLLAQKLAAPLVQEVKIVTALSRSDAAPLIMNRHTQLGVRSWEPIQQARYVNSLRTTGMTIDQLAVATGFTKSNLLGILRTHTMYEIATGLPLDPKTTEIVRDPRRFNASTLERVLGSRLMRNFLGISFDDKGEVVGTVPAAEFKKAYSRIIQDITTGDANTRKLNNEEGIKAYLKRLTSVAPKGFGKGSFTSASLLGRTGEANRGTATLAAKTKAHKTSPYLIPKSFKCHLQMPRIAEILFEIKSLRVDGFENAVGALLRTFVELSISHYLESTEKMNPLIARLDKKGTRPSTWTPSLRQMLNDLLENDAEIDIPRQARKALKKAVSDDQYPLSLDSLDQFFHNPYVAPTERQLKQFWNSFESLMEFLMAEHTVKPATKASA